MKEKTQQISEEEYEQIKQELEEILEIQEELKLAVEEQKYKSHVPLAGNFGELLINLMRSNHEIDKEIDLAIKNFLKSLQTKKEIKEKRIKGLYNRDESDTIKASYQNSDIKKIYQDFLLEPGSEIAHRYLHTTYKPRS